MKFNGTAIPFVSDIAKIARVVKAHTVAQLFLVREFRIAENIQCIGKNYKTR